VQLEGVAVDDHSRQVIEDWQYWVAQGYELVSNADLEGGSVWRLATPLLGSPVPAGERLTERQESTYQGESRMLDSPEDVCASQAGSEYPATFVPFSNFGTHGPARPAGTIASTAVPWWFADTEEDGGSTPPAPTVVTLTRHFGRHARSERGQNSGRGRAQRSGERL
jgi:hypothetical protein